MQKGCSKIFLAKFPKCFQHQATFAKDFCTLTIGFLISNKYIYIVKSNVWAYEHAYSHMIASWFCHFKHSYKSNYKPSVIIKI